MNKRISTLLTAGLLMVGALFGSANAAPTAEAAKGDLQNGAKFYLGNTNSSSTEIYLQKQHSKNSLIPLSFKNRCFLGKTPMPTVFRKGACPSLTRCLPVCFLKFFGFSVKNLPKSAKSAGAFLNFDDLLSPFRLPVITISF